MDRRRLEGRTGVLEPVEHRAVATEPIELLESLDAVRREAVQAGDGFAELADQDRSCVYIRFVAEDLSGDRLTVDEVHHEKARLEEVGVGIARGAQRRNGNSGPGGSFEQSRLQRHPARCSCSPDEVRRVSSQDQALHLTIDGPRERPGLTARATGETLRFGHVTAEQRAEPFPQGRGPCGVGLAGRRIAHSRSLPGRRCRHQRP
jgi:hypothetical protein